MVEWLRGPSTWRSRAGVFGGVETWAILVNSVRQPRLLRRPHERATLSSSGFFPARPKQ
jgi:hypothetical protein